MFTGIITDLGTVVSITEGENARRMVINTSFNTDQFAIGASIACDGCCLTAVEKGDGWFAVDVGAETLALTTLKDWQVGKRVNLESSLKLGDELGGHLVMGHVDGLAEIISVQSDGESYRLKIRVPEALAKYIAPKGSVSLNGISLTVNEVEGDVFGVCIIPHTWQVTNISDAKVGVNMHLEIDTLARYVARILGKEAA
jgi:riboflavin synthase